MLKSTFVKSNQEAHIKFRTIYLSSIFLVLPGCGDAGTSDSPKLAPLYETKVFSEQKLFPLVVTAQADDGKYYAVGGMKPHQIALTFDDGPHPKYTREILKTLDDYKALATFFVLGGPAKRNPSVLREIVSKKHKLASHGGNHSRLARSWDSQSIVNSLTSVHKIIEPYMNKNDVWLYRNPGGYWNKFRAGLLNNVQKSGEISKYVGPFWWNVGGGKQFHKNGTQYNVADQSCKSSSRCAEIYYRAIKNNYSLNRGSLVLMHDIHMVSARMLPLLLEKLRKDSVRWEFIYVQDIPAVRTLWEKNF